MRLATAYRVPYVRNTKLDRPTSRPNCKQKARERRAIRRYFPKSTCTNPPGSSIAATLSRRCNAYNSDITNLFDVQCERCHIEAVCCAAGADHEKIADDVQVAEEREHPAWSLAFVVAVQLQGRRNRENSTQGRSNNTPFLAKGTH